ncbi:2Fe-2S iron-sulfur cluster-binding protein [Nitrincola tapanii]|uniref:2Fe-2S iron-sulfur cluster binding domain-containing protein n=1 Tax=Nitrincola tapanii TaxID=1708751 RepID=A0A5A9W1W3_9GAMM|nr:2Fe-2S iron-sulfur cluster-binding protein [Nitrincola tapanii]KAA0873541.1 2Fe-2S iron-sulfur cluster binding domain-containing protein [Nitrincola tapanii]
MERISIHVVNRDLRFQIPAGQVLLPAMEKTGCQAIAVGCRGGGCGLCKIRVLEGEYQSKRMSRAHITPEEEAAGIVLACRILPTSELVLEADWYQASVEKKEA